MTSTPVAVVGAGVVSVTVNVDVSPTFGVGSLTVFVRRQIGLLRGHGGRGGVVGGVGVELVGVG